MPPRRQLHPVAPREPSQHRQTPAHQKPHEEQHQHKTATPLQQQQQQQQQQQLIVGPGAIGDCDRVSTSAVGVYQNVFPYPTFNPVQSACFERTYKSDDGMLISAPTGSGKTGIMEIAICRLLASAAVAGEQVGSFAVIYFGAFVYTSLWSLDHLAIAHQLRVHSTH